MGEPSLVASGLEVGDFHRTEELYGCRRLSLGGGGLGIGGARLGTGGWCMSSLGKEP